MFECEVGLSGRTLGCGVSVAATALGASVIEKHFTLSREDGGVDSAFSMEPHELKQLREETKWASQALGRVIYGPTDAEVKSLALRRSLYIAEDMNAGEVLNRNNLRRVRPGYGLPSKYYESLLGLKIGRPVKAGTPMDWSLIAPDKSL